MAHRIKAISMYRPRVRQGNTVQKPELLRAISRATNLTEGMVDLVIKELRDQIITFSRTDRAVKVEGMGTYSPNLGLDGNLDLQYRADSVFRSSLNLPGVFTGRIRRREHINMTPAELVARWNDDHPDDPVVE